MAMKRILSHVMTSRLALNRAFPETLLNDIEAAIQHAERQHSGEIRFAIETAFTVPALMRGLSARERAIEVFSMLRVWDTVADNGVLIYILLAERDIEIVADRGFDDRVNEEQWQTVCDNMRAAFAEGNSRSGSLAGIEAVSALIEKHFPRDAEDQNELPDRPLLL